MKKCQKISCAKIALQDIFTLMSWFSSVSRSSNRRMTQARAVNLVGAKPLKCNLCHVISSFPMESYNYMKH